MPRSLGWQSDATPGVIASVEIMKDKLSGNSRGFGYITYATTEAHRPPNRPAAARSSNAGSHATSARVATVRRGLKFRLRVPEAGPERAPAGPAKGRKTARVSPPFDRECTATSPAIAFWSFPDRVSGA